MDIRVPKLGEGAEGGAVVHLHVKVGDKISKDQTLIELENEKAVAPIPSSHAGVVKKIYVKVGDKVSVGQPIVELEESGAGSAAASSAADEKPVAAVPRVLTPLPTRASAQADIHDKSGFPPPASPTVRHMAVNLGIDLTEVRGSQAGGRITVGDLRAYVEGLKKSPVKKETIDFSQWGAVERKPVSSLRQIIGRRMTESWTTIPHVTQFEEADITDLMELRKQFAPAYEKKGAKLTLTGFLILAAAAALKKHPIANASLDEAAAELIYKKYIHIGVAVDTPAGLIVPVLKDADKKSLFEISKELERLAEKTRARKISPEELQGGTFTVSNLGGIGGTFFTPIVNKPQAAILGVGRGVLKSAIAGQKEALAVRSRWMLPLALSYDHRILDGADGARFIRTLAEALENFKTQDVAL